MIHRLPLLLIKKKCVHIVTHEPLIGRIIAGLRQT
jgi:hypothetical protein